MAQRRLVETEIEKLLDDDSNSNDSFIVVTGMFWIYISQIFVAAVVGLA